MAGSTIQSTIKVDYTQVANLAPDAREEFDKLKESLKGLNVTSNEYYDINVKMADLLSGKVAPAITTVADASNKLKTGLEGIASSATLATNSTGELKAGLTSVNNAVNGGFLDSMQKQKIAFTDVGRLITGQGFSLRTLASNFTLLGPTAVIAAAAIGGLAYEVFQYYTKTSDAAKATKAYDDIITGAGKNAIKAAEEVMSMRETFKLAEDGVISKTQAVKIYNESIGKTTGQVTSLKQAEQALQANADAFINMTLQKAVAEAASQKAAQAMIDKLVLQQRQEKDLADAIVYINQTKEDSQDHYIAKVKETQKEEVDKAQDQINVFTKIAKGGYDQMEAIAKQFHFNPLGIDLKDQKKADQAIAHYKKSLEELETYISKLNLAPVVDLHKSLDELQINYNKVVEIAKAAKVPYAKATEDMETERIKIMRSFSAEVMGEQRKDGLAAVEETVLSNKEIDKMIEAALKARLENQKKSYDEEKKVIESGAKVELDVIKNADNNSVLLKAQNAAKRLKIIHKEYADEKSAAIANQQSTAEIDNLITQNKQDQAKAQEDITNAKLQSDIQYATQAASLLNTLSGVMGNSTQAKKDVEIASVSIQAISAAVKAQLSALTFFAADDYPSGIIAEAAAVEAIIQGAAQIAKIEAVTVPHSSGASNSAASLGGGAASYVAPQVPQAVQTTNLSGQSIQQIQSVNQNAQPVRAYVVEQDITTSQNRVAGFRNAASLGSRTTQ